MKRSFGAARWQKDRYQAPAKDSPRAIADLLMYLNCARSIEDATAEHLAHLHRVTLATATAELAAERARRERLL